MKTTKKVTSIGGCLGIIIDKPIAKMLKIKKGMMVEIDIKVVKE